MNTNSKKQFRRVRETVKKVSTENYYFISVICTVPTMCLVFKECEVWFLLRRVQNEEFNYKEGEETGGKIIKILKVEKCMHLCIHHFSHTFQLRMICQVPERKVNFEVGFEGGGFAYVLCKAVPGTGWH